MTTVIAAISLWVLAAAIVAARLCGPALAAAWREPVIRAPVFIIESDDWGAGPSKQAAQLGRIAKILASHTNRHGQHPVMTLGIVLAIANGSRIVEDGLRRYHRKGLRDVEFADTRAAIQQGRKAGVFALQLHGLEHYWPDALLAAARTDPLVAGWLAGSARPMTEALPDHLQSRWVDARTLPSKPLGRDEITTAAREEVAAFGGVFGETPTVAVPPTFIWNAWVEAAWADAGVRVVVTPGQRYEARDSGGRPVGGGAPIVNGDRGESGLVYLVRDDYFEPARGHVAERGVTAVRRKSGLGRPTLLETHRASFVGDEAVADGAINELDDLLRRVISEFPDVVFLSSYELAERLRRRDPMLVESRLVNRIHVWLRRSWDVARVRKLAWLTGMVIPGLIAYAVTRRQGSGYRRMRVGIR